MSEEKSDFVPVNKRKGHDIDLKKMFEEIEADRAKQIEEKLKEFDEKYK